MTRFEGGYRPDSRPGPPPEPPEGLRSGIIRPGPSLAEKECQLKRERAENLLMNFVMMVPALSSLAVTGWALNIPGLAVAPLTFLNFMAFFVWVELRSNRKD